MENGTVNSPGTAEGTETSTAAPQLEQLASQLAAKHAASSNGARRGGRKTAQEEAAEYLSRNRLRAVPLDESGAPGGPQADDPGGEPAFERGYVVTPDFVKTCADTLLRGVEAYRKRQVFLTVQKLNPSLAPQFADEAGAPPGAIEVMSLCAAELAQKYDAFAKCGPEALLCVAAATWVGKDLALHKKLSALAKIKAAQPPPAGNTDG
jgi:hypothetical protein